MSRKKKECPFCGSRDLYNVYHKLDWFTTPFIFCNWCKALFTIEGSEDWVQGGPDDGMAELEDAWNRRTTGD